MQKNIPAVLKVIQYIYDNTMYAELNSKSDYCMECGYDGEVEMKKDDEGKLYWQCPNCGNTDLNRMSIVRRVCGYLSSNTANQGRMADIHDRVLHL
jgi:ribonucleoside-triphosphate reductase